MFENLKRTFSDMENDKPIEHLFDDLDVDSNNKIKKILENLILLLKQYKHNK